MSILNQKINRRRVVTVAVGGLLTLAQAASPASAQKAIVQKPLRIAVFNERNFPLYGVSGMVGPIPVVRDLQAAGFEADLVSTDDLISSNFNAQKYAALVLLYGNTYPQEAFASMRRFHQAGGSLITTGIPFTHPVERVAAREWNASPGWSANVRRVAGAGPAPDTNAFLVVGTTGNWSGVDSARVPVAPGDTVEASVQLRQVAHAERRRESRRAAGSSNDKDEYFVRFFDQNRQFIGQTGVTVEPEGRYQRFSVVATAPKNAAFADVSFQVRRVGRRYYAAGFALRRNGQTVALPNGDLSQVDSGRFADMGHTDKAARFGADGVGVGGFAGPDSKRVAPATIAPGDPLRLTGAFTPNPAPRPAPQWVDAKSLPRGVEIIPTIGSKDRPLGALIVHKDGPFKGAVDAWTYRASNPEREMYEGQQLITRAVVGALRQRGLLSEPERTAAIARLDALPTPKVYRNVVLPTVPRRYPTFQPKSVPPARQLHVADVSKLSEDERFLLITLQGVVNRTEPRIYLLFDRDDRLWLDEMRKRGATDAPIEVADPFTLLETFRSSYKGAVVCDPNVYDSPCVAVSLAGADDVIVAKTVELAEKHKLPVAVDLRGKFKDNADAIDYIRTELLPRLDPYLSCTLDPMRYDKGGLDQLIAARGSAFWITGPKAADLPGANSLKEQDAVRALLAAMPLGAVVRGFWWNGDGVGLPEEYGVALGSRLGKITLVSDLISNLSVHSGVTLDKLTQKPRTPTPVLDPNKVYLSFTMSDGDNLCTWRGYFRRYFEDPVRGSVPVGWGMGPALIDLAPQWAQWYYEAATPNDEFLCDVSGVAYIYPPDWAMSLRDREAALRFFYGETEKYMRRMDMQTIRLMNVDTPSIARVGELMPQTPFLMPDYGHQGGQTYRDHTYTLPTGQTVYRALTNGSGPKNFANQIRQRTRGARPAFVNVFVYNWESNLGDLKKTMEELGPEYVAVLPSQLDALYRQANSPKRSASK